MPTVTRTSALTSVEPKRPVDARLDGHRSELRDLAAGSARDRDRELIPTDAARRGRPGWGALQPARNLGKHGVAGVVAEHVVDFVEAVDIEQDEHAAGADPRAVVSRNERRLSRFAKPVSVSSVAARRRLSTSRPFSSAAASWSAAASRSRRSLRSNSCGLQTGVRSR